MKLLCTLEYYFFLLLLCSKKWVTIFFTSKLIFILKIFLHRMFISSLNLSLFVRVHHVHAFSSFPYFFFHNSSRSDVDCLLAANWNALCSMFVQKLMTFSCGLKPIVNPSLLISRKCMLSLFSWTALNPSIGSLWCVGFLCENRGMGRGSKFVNRYHVFLSVLLYEH